MLSRVYKSKSNYFMKIIFHNTLKFPNNYENLIRDIIEISKFLKKIPF